VEPAADRKKQHKKKKRTSCPLANDEAAGLKKSGDVWMCGKETGGASWAKKLPEGGRNSRKRAGQHGESVRGYRSITREEENVEVLLERKQERRLVMKSKKKSY